MPAPEPVAARCAPNPCAVTTLTPVHRRKHDNRIRNLSNVDAIFADTVSDAGVVLSAWTGVNVVTAQGLGHIGPRRASGAGITTVGPGQSRSGQAPSRMP